MQMDILKFRHLMNTGFVGSQATVSLLDKLTIAKRNTPFVQFESGLSTGVKHD